MSDELLRIVQLIVSPSGIAFPNKPAKLSGLVLTQCAAVITQSSLITQYSSLSTQFPSSLVLPDPIGPFP